MIDDERLTPEDRKKIDHRLIKALKWRGWDEAKRCDCHACDAIREIS